MHYGAILLPGIVTPAEVAYRELRAEFANDDPIVLRELAVYDGDTPPDDYGLGLEVESVLRTADRAGFDRFHLAGYSAGGAVAAAFAAGHGDRLMSLALLEPAWLGNVGLSDAERRALDAADAATNLPAEQAMPEFIRLNLAAGTPLPPPPAGDPPPWMAKRPAAMRVIVPAFNSYELDYAALRKLMCPVLYVLGRLSNPDLYATRAERADGLFADFTLEVFEDRHHFDPPHRAEPKRSAALLRSFWQDAESRADPPTGI